MPHCPYYGMHCAADFRMLVASHANQCALPAGRYAPCEMTLEGHAPDLEACSLAKRTPYDIVVAATKAFKVWPQDGNGLVTFQEWEAARAEKPQP